MENKNETIKELENKKNDLESAIDAITEKINKLKNKNQQFKNELKNHNIN